MSDVDSIVKRLLAEGKYAVNVEHIEQGKNRIRKIFVMDVIHVLFSDKSKHYEGTSLDKKLVIFSEGPDSNDRVIRVVSRLIDSDGEIIFSVMFADLSEKIFAKTAYELDRGPKNEN